MNKVKVALIRGAFLNPNELANYEKLKSKINLESFSSQKPLGTNFNIKNRQLPCPLDYPFFGLTKFVLNRTLGDPHWLIGLTKYLNQYQILDTADPYYFYSYQAAKIKQKHPSIKLLCTYCETIPHNNESILTKKKLKYFVLKTADIFAVHTERSRKCLLAEGVKAQKIKLIRLGVDLKKYRGQPKQNNGLLFVGRLVPEKGVWQLYQVFKQLLKKYQKTHLTLVGKGPLEKQIRQDIWKNNLQNKIKLYSRNYQDIYLEYQNAQIFVFPSHSLATWEEQYGMALIEAMASGLPIVTTDCGAIPEIIGSAGLICPQNNPKALFKNLNYLLNSPQKQKTLARQSRQRAEKYFDSSVFAVTIKDIYDELLNSYSG